MNSKFIRSLFVMFTAIFFSCNAVAGNWSDYTEQQFKQEQSKGRSIVLDFYAEWCSSCLTQKTILKELLSEPDFKNVIVFVVNYDEFSDLKKELDVDSQGTLIVYKGNKEVARGFGIIKKDEVQALVSKGL